MSGLRTFLAALALAAAGGSAPAAELADTFAQCTGRLSALMEHQWLMGEDATRTEAERAAMIALLQAVQPAPLSPEAGAQILNRRIEAKFAHARLLQRTTFNDDPADAARALRLADLRISSCRALLLG